MDNNNMQDYIKSAKRVVVKVGSELIYVRFIQYNAADISKQLNDKEICLVSSGAIKVGKEKCRELDGSEDTIPGSSKNVPKKQLQAAIGQPGLMHLYEREYYNKGIKVAQMLVTRDKVDLDTILKNPYISKRPELCDYLVKRSDKYNPSKPITEKELYALPNIDDVFVECFLPELNSHFNKQYNWREVVYSAFNSDPRVLPILNENDTMVVEEIKYGDNDPLSAHIAKGIGADLLIILTKEKGIKTKEAMENKTEDIIQYASGDEIEYLVSNCLDTKSANGSGGMKSKPIAAQIALSSNIPTLITDGRVPHIIDKTFSGNAYGTFIYPKDLF